MANPTNPFSWQMPTASDLVTDLPADFETFGQAVATSMADLLGGTTGQVLSKASNTDMDFTWVTSDDANAIQNTIVDAKGDLIAATAADTPARLAVGANDTMLVADSTAATGLAYKSATTLYPWTAWTPTLTGIVIGNGNVSAKYQQIGKTIIFNLRLEYGSTSSITGRVSFSLPVTPAKNQAAFALLDDYGSIAPDAASGLILTNGNLYVEAINTAGTYAKGAYLSTTIPFTWSSLDSIAVTGSYEGN
jgi:hypothetical protein